MLAMILGILKVIGLLILGILGVALALLLLVLLVPIRYWAEGAYYGALKGQGRVTWLFRILSCQVAYDGEPDMCIRVFGIRIGPGREADGENSAKAGTEKSEKGREKASAKAGEREAARAGAQDMAQDTAQDTANGKPQTVKMQEDADAGSKKAADAQKTPESAPKNPRRTRRRFHLPNPIEKIKVTFRRICDKLKALKEKQEAVLEFVGREENKRTFRLLKKQVFALLKHILPGKVKGLVRFGFDDPYTTGQILMYASPFYGLYARNLQLIPVFEEPVLEGELKLKGRIRIGTVLGIAIRVLLDKNFRSLLKKWREA